MIETREYGAVTELQLNRPPVNALNPQLIQALSQRLTDVVAGGTRAVVLSGGENVFCAGLDVPLLLRLSREEITNFWNDFFGLMRRLAECPIPLSAAITGHSPAGGAVLTLFCDHRVMSRGEFRIGLNEVQVGLPVPDLICHALARLVGTGAANRLLVSGELMYPEEALRIGFVDALAHDPADTRDEALAWASSVTVQPPLAVSVTRRIARADLTSLFSNVNRETGQAMSDVWFSKETRKAMHELAQRLSSKQ